MCRYAIKILRRDAAQQDKKSFAMRRSSGSDAQVAAIQARRMSSASSDKEVSVQYSISNIVFYIYYIHQIATNSFDADSDDTLLYILLFFIVAIIILYGYYIGYGVFTLIIMLDVRVTPVCLFCMWCAHQDYTLANMPEALVHEITILKMLCHPNLVRLCEVINDEDSRFVYLVMEQVEGGEIMGIDQATGRYVYRLTGTVMGEATARRTFKDLISALSYLHANHVAHRDIKV